MAKRHGRGHSLGRSAPRIVLRDTEVRILHRSQEIRMSPTNLTRGTAVVAAVASSALGSAACSGSSGGSSSGGAADTSKVVIGLEPDQAALGYAPVRYGSGQ